ncbi:MAG: hypothetical protein WBA45_08345 [Microthrixaceae bacterium]
MKNPDGLLAHARETIGLALAMEDHGATTFRNGARVSGVLRHPQKCESACKIDPLGWVMSE